jgi:hypothetical protein
VIAQLVAAFSIAVIASQAALRLSTSLSSSTTTGARTTAQDLAHATWHADC